MREPSRPSACSLRQTARAEFDLSGTIMRDGLGWSLEDIQAIEAFLSSEATALENPMDVSMIEGFFCALISGPNMVSPLQALPWVYDSERGEQEPVFDSMAEAQQLMGLLMKQWNATASGLMSPEGAYEPLLGGRDLDDGWQVFILDEWCSGYLLGMKLDQAAWMPLLLAEPNWFATLLRYGSEEGRRLMEAESPSDAEHEEAAAGLALQAMQIQRYWLERRADAPARQQPQRRSGPKLGRNEPCHCGSGRKFKHCHGAT